MDNGQTADLGAILAKLSENPAILSTLTGLMASQARTEPKAQTPPSNIDFEKIISMMGAMSGGSSPSRQSAAPPLGALQMLLGSPNTSSDNILGSREDMDRRIHLLNALRPYLGESRRSKLDMIIKLLKLLELGELGSLLKNIM